MEIWSGIDVGKKTFQASWVSAESRGDEFHKIRSQEFARTRKGVSQYLKWLRKLSEKDSSIRVVMEATGRYSLELHAWLVRAQPELKPAIVNPKLAKHFHQSLGLRNKNDSVDARSLGLMGRERQPEPFQPLEPEYQHLRDLMRQRRVLVQARIEERSRLEQFQNSPKVAKFVRSHLQHLERLLARIEKELQKLVQKSPQLQPDVDRLMTIPGVGQITALTVLGELGDLRRFKRSRQVSAMAGLTPHNVESGSSTQYSRLDRMGSPQVRKVLYMAALTMTRNTKYHLGRTYLHLIEENHLCKKEALVAIMRKTLVLMRAMLISNSDYQDDFCRKH
jgi:transposase